MQEIKVKKIDDKLSDLAYTGDWVDIRVSAIISVDSKDTESARDFAKTGIPVAISAGDTVKIAHGFALELPEGYEAIVLPRSSLFKNTGLIFATSGVIDEGYNGNNDEWFTVFYATEDCILTHNERVAQFRIQKKQPELKFRTVDDLGNSDRGGHGSTGKF